MSNTAHKRTERVEAIVTREQKRLFQYAAALEGRSLTDFLLASAQAAAAETISRRERLKLTRRDQRVFINALLSPPAPTKALKAAAARYRKGVKDDLTPAEKKTLPTQSGVEGGDL